MEPTISPRRAREIIDALRRGTVPERGLETFAVGLERFREVVLDFAGVDAIGQGFADEVFRVWARAHAGTRLQRGTSRAQGPSRV